jgi:tryptophan-rich sensory protein
MRAKTSAGASAAVTATSVIGALASRADTTWYRRLRKPPFQPPPVAFPLVWTGLYAAIAAGSAAAIDVLDDDARDRFVGALAVNLALNAGWTWCFFRLRRPWLATAESAVLTLSTADLVAQARAAGPRAYGPLLPYLGWTAFATALSGSIAWLNRR